MTLPFKFPDRYDFTGKRLEGGQGYVYVCKDKLLDRHVAVKVMKNVLDARILRQELAMIRCIRSKHIAEIYDLLSAKRSGMVGLVQEFVPGEDVAEWAQSERDPMECLKVIHQIASGISDIHSCKKIHRDIKPNNIKFDAEHVVKILDFGLTIAADPKAETVLARGTRFYLAPELYASRPIRITPAIDTYAFGVTSAVICNGGKLHKGLRVIPPDNVTFSFASAKVQLPKEVVQILDAALSAISKDRPTMADVKNVVERRLLYGRHRALVHTDTSSQVLSTPGKLINLQRGGDAIAIEYDGIYFRIRTVQGDVFINNQRADTGALLPGSCVLTIGNRNLGADRKFITVDISHPGVDR